MTSDMPLSNPQASRRLVPCLHCGTPTRVSDATQMFTQTASVFCCSGCQTVYQFIHTQGLADYYRLTPQPDVQILQREKPQDFSGWDDPSHGHVDESGVRSVVLYVEGIHCAACLWLLEKLPELNKGVLQSQVSMGQSTLSLRLSSEAVLSEIAGTIAKLGYIPHVLQGQKAADLWQLENRNLLVRLGVSGALAGNVMLMSVSLYGGAEGVYAQLFSWLSALLCLPVVTWGAWPFYQGAMGALRLRRVSIDVPIALALILGFVSSVMQLLWGEHHLYFDSLAMLTFFLLGSRYMLTLMQRKAHRVSDLHTQVLPAQAEVVIHAGAENDVSLAFLAKLPTEKSAVSTLVPGDIICVGAGDVLPADGQVLAGESDVDVSWITGESVPQPVGPASDAYAGTRNLLAPLYLRVVSSGDATRVGRLLSAIAAYPKAHVALAMDRLAQRLLVAILIVSSAALVFFGVSGQFAEGFNRVLALLIVTCPCALAIATPLALANGLRRAALSGILIRNPDIIELTEKVSHVFLDKTGTLTRGYLAVASVEVVNTAVLSEAQAHALAYTMESQSQHPIGRAIFRYYTMPGVDVPVQLTIGSLKEVSGKGMRGIWEGQTVEMVGDGMVSEAGSDTVSDSTLRTAVRLCVDGETILRYRLSDTLYPDAEMLVPALREAGFHVQVLSGDHPDVVAHLALQLGLQATEWRGGVSPEAKIEAVTNAFSMMVGDGANDAVALKAATVGVAVHGSLDASMKAADVYLGKPGLATVLQLLDICAQTRRVIRRNLAISLVYNGVFCVAALMGWINPLVAAVLMPMSSLTVVLSSMWQPGEGSREKKKGKGPDAFEDAVVSGS